MEIILIIFKQKLNFGNGKNSLNYGYTILVGIYKILK